MAAKLVSHPEICGKRALDFGGERGSCVVVLGAVDLIEVDEVEDQRERRAVAPGELEMTSKLLLKMPAILELRRIPPMNQEHANGNEELFRPVADADPRRRGATAGGIADLCFEHSESRVSRQTA